MDHYINLLQTLIKNKNEDSWIFTKLCGGLTNTVYKCEHPELKVILRIYGQNTENLVNRSNEINMLKHLELHGNNIKVLLEFENGYVTNYIDGQPIDIDDVYVYYKLIAKKMRELHETPKISVNEGPWLNQTIYNYLNICKSLTKTYYDLNHISFQRLEQHATILLKKLDNETHLTDIVLCHNDINYTNILYDVEKNDVHFIDYEYCGANYRGFDIANHLKGVYHIDAFLKEYYGNDNYIKDKEQITIFTQLAYILWTCWSIIQYENTNNIEYLEHAIITFNRIDFF